MKNGEQGQYYHVRIDSSFKARRRIYFYFQVDEDATTNNENGEQQERIAREPSTNNQPNGSNNGSNGGEDEQLRGISKELDKALDSVKRIQEFSTGDKK